ncbi:MAG TPA: hypothetical protein ENJ51_12375 [Leucothrix mucor]|uniref:GH16 domain-containing protein n=1 Tax=Leucothrix mucor TaxID=45248 RepID=A0A7V2T597_LEUMU|nr:hypothetical protein [Leucothrix mucor]
MTNNHNYAFLLGLLLITIVSCKGDRTNSITQGSLNEAKLLFSSGFEKGVYIDTSVVPDSEDFRFIRGTDLETGDSWPIDVLGASESGIHYIDDDNQNAIYSEIQSVKGHDGNQTKALYSIENYDIGVTQNPYEILNIVDGRKDLYVKYWMKLDSSSLNQIDKWRALFEYKTIGYAKGTGFRLIAFIYTDIQGTPFWHFQGDENPTTAIWEVDNTDIPVPMNQWFSTEFYWHWSEGKDGKVFWKINGQLVAKHIGPTTRNAQPIDFIILTQLYGDANPKFQWIDDIEIWDGLPLSNKVVN